MRVMKVIVGLVLVIGVVSGCATSMPLGVLHTELKLPVAVTDNSGKAAKVGRAQCTSMLGLVATGDASIDAAKRNGGITKIHYIDWEVKNTLGIMGTYTLVVYGE